MHYPGNTLNGFGGAVGVSNLKEARVGTNLVWTPLKGFDIGARLQPGREEAGAVEELE